MAPNPQAEWPTGYVFGGWFPRDPRGPEDAGWEWWPEPPPPPPLRHDWQDCCCCFVIVFVVCITAIVEVIALLAMTSSPAPSNWTALALLPTCPAAAPALSTPPVCYEWEKPAAAAMVLPGCACASADYSNWWSDEQDGNYKGAKKCFDSLVRDAAWTCDEQQDDYKAAMKCFDSHVRDAARMICSVWSYDAIPLTRQSDYPPYHQHD